MIQLGLFRAPDVAESDVAESDASGVLGDGGRIEIGKRGGASPWSRVRGSTLVRCVIGDIEFGLHPDVAGVVADACAASGKPWRIAAQEVMTDAILRTRRDRDKD